MNFIDVDCLASSCAALAPLVDLDELYLTGNPCTTFVMYRSYVIHVLQRLDKLDGVDITLGERITARRDFDQAAAVLNEIAIIKRDEKKRIESKKATDDAHAASIAAAEAEAAAALRADGRDDDDVAEAAEISAAAATASAAAAYALKSQQVSAYTPESRLEMHREAEALEIKKEADKKQAMKGNQPEDMWKEAQKKVRKGTKEKRRKERRKDMKSDIMARRCTTSQPDPTTYLYVYAHAPYPSLSFVPILSPAPLSSFR